MNDFSVPVLDKLRIGSVSQLLGVSNTMIRLLEQEAGMAVERSESGSVKQRLFSPDDVFTLAMQRRAARKRSVQGKLNTDRPTVIAVYNAKGGVAKTTCAVELATHLQARSYRTLVVDLDPQGSATTFFGYDPDLDEETAEKEGISPDRLITKTFGHLLNLPPVFTGKDTLKDVIKMPYGQSGPHLIPSDLLSTHLEFMLFGAADRDRKILNFIEAGRPGSKNDLSDYDFVIFDCAPAISFVTRAAVVAADLVLSPVSLDALSVKGLSYLSSLVEESQEAKRATIDIMAVPTFFRHNRARIVDNHARMRLLYKGYIAETTIRDTEAVPKLQNTPPHAPIALRAPADPVSHDFRDLALEVLSKTKGD